MMTKRKKRFLWIFAVIIAFALLALCCIGGFIAYHGGIVQAKDYLVDNHLDTYLKIKKGIMEYDIEVPGIGKKLNLPVFNIELSRADVAHFSDLYQKFENPAYGEPYYRKHNTWRNAELHYKGKKYKIKIKAHGQSPNDHRNGPFISYGIKLSKRDQINNARRFSLIIRERVLPERLRTFHLSDKFGIITQPEQLVWVKINNREKLYYFEHKLEDAYMESIGKASYKRFETDFYNSMVYGDNQKSGETFNERTYLTSFNDILKTEDYSDAYDSGIINRYLAFNKAITGSSPEKIKDFFDQDYITSYLAVRLIAGYTFGHGFVHGNFYVFLDTASGKFYPALQRDNIVEMLKPAAGRTLEEQLNCFPDGRVEFPMFSLLAADDQIRQEKYYKIYKLIADNPDLAAIHNKIVEEIETTHLFGIGRLILQDIGFNAYKNITENNVKILKAYLEKSEPEVSFFQNKGLLIIEVQPHSISDLKFKKFSINVSAKQQSFPVKLEIFSAVDDDVNIICSQEEKIIPIEGEINLISLVDNVPMSTAIGKESQRLKRAYYLTVTLPGRKESGKMTGKDIEIAFVNAITGRFVISALTEDSSLKSRIQQMSGKKIDRKHSLKRFREKHETLKFSFSENTITVNPGTYIIRNDLIVPKNYKLIIEADTKLLLGENSLLFAPNGIDMNGTAGQPVIITALDPEKPFGSIGVMGDKTASSHIKYLQLSHGSERWHKGIYFSGGLSLHYNKSVLIENSIIRECHADDGVNIKYAESISIKHCKFYDNSADQVDLDYCNGIVDKSEFRRDTAMDVNGDGLDVSGSKIIIRNCVFSGFKDKGLSIGEKSDVFLFNNTIRKNNWGVAVKDLSNVFFIKNHFNNNKLDINAYQKKVIFGGGNVFLEEGTDKKKLQCRLDDKSQLKYFTPLIPDKTLNSHEYRE